VNYILASVSGTVSVEILAGHYEEREPSAIQHFSQSGYGADPGDRFCIEFITIEPQPRSEEVL
jgi:hypothetical protein